MKKPTFAAAKAALLDGLREQGWVVVDGLKTPHATYEGIVRLWFKSQAIYINDPGTNPRDFANTHSLTSDMRDYSVADLLAAVLRWQKEAP